MRTREFDALCERVLAEKGSKAEDRQALVDYATLLRLFAMDLVDRLDEWDREWPELGYDPYPEVSDEGDTYDELRAWRSSWCRRLFWAKTHNGQI
jgi:hypothetical protein